MKLSQSQMGGRSKSIWSRCYLSLSSFKICFTITSDSSAQWLQFRILVIQRILPVGKYWKNANINTSDFLMQFLCKNQNQFYIFLCLVLNCRVYGVAQVFIYMYTLGFLKELFNVSNVIFGELPLSYCNKVNYFIILR